MYTIAEQRFSSSSEDPEHQYTIRVGDSGHRIQEWFARGDSPHSQGTSLQSKCITPVEVSTESLNSDTMIWYFLGEDVTRV